MWYTTLWEIGKWIFTKLPIEKLVARVFTTALAKISNADDLAKIAKSVQHINESTTLIADIIADAEVSEEEVNLIINDASALKVKILNLWAKGKSAKPEEEALSNMENCENCENCVPA